MNKFQNYTQFRSAQHQLMANHSTKTTVNNKKPSHIYQIYMKERTNVNGEEKRQEYNRYRHATANCSTKVFHAIVNSHLEICLFHRRYIPYSFPVIHN